jgi:hypothetical protein
MYEVNANGNRSYRATSARHAAVVAAKWAKAGFAPKAYAVVSTGTGVECREVPVTTATKTAQDLARASR